LAQRDIAIARGIQLVAWTFDPVMSLNAHLNIRKLGGISSTYQKDYYGTRNLGGLSPLGTSDRLLVHWWVTSKQVAEHVAGDHDTRSLTGYRTSGATIVNPTGINQAGWAVPPQESDADNSPVQLVEIPPNFSQIAQADVVLAKQWQLHVRDVLGGLIQTGYTVTDFVKADENGRTRTFYVLAHHNPKNNIQS
jgi:predicted GNAT superfamily acetyltransferase